MAEREGFEPSIGINLYALSRGAPSATRPPLRSAASYHNGYEIIDGAGILHMKLVPAWLWPAGGV